MISFGVQSSMRVAELIGGKAAENHRVDCAKAGAGKHGKQRLRNHRHVNDDAVAFDNAKISDRCGKRLHFGLRSRL